jgi:hypothetical protein
VKKTYHIVNRDEKTATASIEQFAKSNGQLLLPLLELITQARVAVDEVISGRGLESAASAENPLGGAILEAIPSKQAWVALGWRQYLYWFADAEFRLSAGAVSAEDLISIADGNWANIEKSKPALLMEERQNDGSWVRQWYRALIEFPLFR